eukprot:CAMPEP_0115430110 /NCGR_PEP_ID=MMETSP0271-20121206/30875_1 /TAXON_ID=71861 /ORGANISM="Scrippsiella trochoidea, Strain CCMP3099" /LENGTH=38 /DNA_ID= /DNA_START= /DNA_END= /DNA_ORIENTATION=
MCCRGIESSSGAEVFLTKPSWGDAFSLHPAPRSSSWCL